MARFDFMSFDARPSTGGQHFSEHSFLFDMQGAKASWFFHTPERVTITHLGYYHRARVGTPSTFRISLRHVTSTGYAEDSILASQTFTPPADSSWNDTFQWLELIAPYNAGRGERLCGVLEWASGYINPSNRIEIYDSLYLSRDYGFYPYVLNQRTADERRFDIPIFAYKSSYRTYGWPWKGWYTTAWNSPAEVGLRILLNKNYGSTYKILGAAIEGAPAGRSARTTEMILYEETPTGPAEVNRVTLDGDIAESLGSRGSHEFFFDDPTLATLGFGKEYFLVFAPNEGDTDFTLVGVEVPSSDDLSAFPGAGNFYMVSRTSPTGEFTRHKTIRPQMDLFIDDWSK